MARRTLASKYEAYDAAQSLQRQILCYNKDAKEIYYDVEPVEEAEEEPTESSPAPSQAAAAAPVTFAAPTPGAGPAAQVADAPVQATDVVRAIIAQKLKKPFGDIPLSKAIKDLVNGKSTLQNEILGGEGPPTPNLAGSSPLTIAPSQICKRNLVPLPKSPKMSLSTSWGARFSPHSTASWANSRAPSSLDWSPARCPVASTSRRCANTLPTDGGSGPDVRTELCCSPSLWSRRHDWAANPMPRPFWTLSRTSTPPRLVSPCLRLQPAVPAVPEVPVV